MTTWRCIWDVPGTPFPAWADFPTSNEAHRHALHTSRALGCEVEVHEIQESA